MTIDCVYYNDFIRCFRNGRVERINRQRPKNGWSEVENTANTHDGYNEIRINDKMIKRHRLLAFCFLGLENIVGDRHTNSIDHEDEDKINNAVSNLRIVSNGENQQNQKKVKGYSYHKRYKKYQAEITVNKKTVYLGRFDAEIEARNAYVKAKEIYHKYSPII
jgi:hypothetical protein